ncbi:MAG TPA: hypothetical protein VFO40_24265 [Chthoniobacterales bacterium]|nr:hypothetical protein [Chthoniobacterales bacterium]
MTREPRPGEIEQAIPRAYEQEFNGNSSRTSEPKAEYDPAKLERIANRINFDVHPNGSRLDHLGVAGTGLQPDSCTRYERGERIWIGTTKDARRGELYVHGGDQEDFRCLDHLREGNEGVWFLSNPVTGEAAEGVGTVNEFYAKGESWRSEENVTSWRYLLIESDKATENLWLRMLVQAPLAISAIYTSGSRSIYTLVYCYIDF